MVPSDQAESTAHTHTHTRSHTALAVSKRVRVKPSTTATSIGAPRGFNEQGSPPLICWWCLERQTRFVVVPRANNKILTPLIIAMSGRHSYY